MKSNKIFLMHAKNLSATVIDQKKYVRIIFRKTESLITELATVDQTYLEP